MSIALGEIAQTTYSSGPGDGSGSLVINHDPIRPKFSIQDKADSDFYYEGQWVSKMGQRTGWTTGQITDACVTVNGDYQGQNYRLFCQTYASYHSLGGDSGSPVFNRPYIDSGQVRLYGIHWGRVGNSAIFSRIAGVEEDLGTLTVN